MQRKKRLQGTSVHWPHAAAYSFAKLIVLGKRTRSGAILNTLTCAHQHPSLFCLQPSSLPFRRLVHFPSLSFISKGSVLCEYIFQPRPISISLSLCSSCHRHSKPCFTLPPSLLVSSSPRWHVPKSTMSMSVLQTVH